jgi:hypothetical protein
LPRPAPPAISRIAAVAPAEEAARVDSPDHSQSSDEPRRAEPSIRRRAEAKSGKRQARKHAVAPYRKRKPFKLFGMLFGGWRR